MESKKCSQRIDELATPKRGMLLSLYREHSKTLDINKVEKLKLMLQELYPMTPEQTAKYFANLRERTKALILKRKLKQKLAQKKRHLKYLEKRNKAFCRFNNILRKFLMQAFKRQIPPLISERLRFVSDLVLGKISALVGMETPVRQEYQIGTVEYFLITIADWIAINLNYLSFEIKQKEDKKDEQDEEEICDCQL